MTPPQEILGLQAFLRPAMPAVICLFLACHGTVGAATDGASIGGSGGGGAGADGGVDRVASSGAVGGATAGGVAGGTDLSASGGGAGGGGGGSTGNSGAQTPDGGGSDLGGCLGVCLETFFEPCSRLGQTCVSSTSGNQTTMCYANGVKVLSTVAGDTKTNIVKKANGDICFQETGTTSIQYVYDPDGGLVAGIVVNNLTVLTITCLSPGSAPGTVGTTTDTSLLDPQCAAYAAENAPCATGTCVW